ncbi:hypothetical protein ACOMHN_048969 [Nucella lapillus]
MAERCWRSVWSVAEHRSRAACEAGQCSITIITTSIRERPVCVHLGPPAATTTTTTPLLPALPTTTLRLAWLAG